MTRRLNYWLLACIAIIAVPYYWYLMADPASSKAAPKPVTVTQLRQLANSLPGPHPVQVRAELLGQSRIMRNRLVAGWGLRPVPAMIWSYELTIPGKPPVVIDAGVSARTVDETGVIDFDRAAQKRVNAALGRAAHAVILSDSTLHTGNRKLPPADARTTPYALAPGIVVMPAPGLGRHAKLVYVRLANGREFLFAGPAARVRENLETLRPPARLAQRTDVPDSGTETKSWLMTINALRRAAPDMTVITAHDQAYAPHVWKRFSDHT